MVLSLQYVFPSGCICSRPWAGLEYARNCALVVLPSPRPQLHHASPALAAGCRLCFQRAHHLLSSLYRAFVLPYAEQFKRGVFHSRTRSTGQALLLAELGCQVTSEPLASRNILEHRRSLHQLGQELVPTAKGLLDFRFQLPIQAVALIPSWL